MATWDRRTPAQLAKQRDAGVRAQLLDAVAPFSPFWRDRFAELGRPPALFASVEGLRALPALGERDLCPDGDPAGAAGLVLQVGEGGFAQHAHGPRLRQALRLRVAAPGSYRAVVEADTRPTSYVYAGRSLRFPVASTRSDLDLVARAGARLWQVLGLGAADVVVSALPSGPFALQQALSLAALASASPLLAPGDDPSLVLDTLAAVPASVLVVPAVGGASLLLELADAGARLTTLTTVLVAGAPDRQQRDDIDDALDSLDDVQATLLAVHVPDGHRLLWGECRQAGGGGGLHTYPDLEVAQLVDPPTGAHVGGEGPGELVITQLGLRGSALLRWRTGELAGRIDESSCPGCRRNVPRVVGARTPARLS
ncbi:MAG: hypothetical protein JWN88_1074 [Frankiales bacterium]|nr:hypothetical protein [Frankiales bacterium]